MLAASLCSSSMMIAATAMENFTLHSDVEAREGVWLFLHCSQVLPPAEGQVSQRRELCQNLHSTKPQLPQEMVLGLVVVSGRCLLRRTPHKILCLFTHWHL